MHVGVCQLRFRIPENGSLKDKRRVLKAITTRLTNKFNVSVAEVDQLGARQSAVIAAVTVSADRDYAHTLLMRVANWVDQNRLDCYLVDYDIELL